MTRINQTLTAEILGVTVVTLRKWTADGEGPPYNEDDFTYDAEHLGAWIRTEMVFKRGRGGGHPYLPDQSRLMSVMGATMLPGLLPTEPVITTKEQEDTRLARLKADKQELDNTERAGALVPADEIEAAWTEIMQRVKAKLTGIPSKAAPLVHAKGSAHEVQAVLDDFMREALEEMANDTSHQ